MSTKDKGGTLDSEKSLYDTELSVMITFTIFSSKNISTKTINDILPQTYYINDL